MQFGLFYIVPWHESGTAEQALREALEQIEYAEALGFDEVWLGEHHFSRHGILSGIFTFLGQVAARTKRMRIGTGIVALPFHNPVLVAEEMAMLDVLSGGRVDFGVGSGYQRGEYEGLGVDIDEARDRFREAVDVIRLAWTSETLTFHGRFTDVADKAVIPKPLQKPHPPMYVAVSTSPETVDYAASQGLPIMGGGPTAVMGHTPDVIRLWRERMDFYGHPHEHVRIPVSMSAYVAPTAEEAESDPLPYQDYTVKMLAKLGSPGDKTGKMAKGFERWGDRQRDRETLAEQNEKIGLQPLRGTPEIVAERLAVVRDLGIDRLFGHFGFPGLPHDKVMRSMELFATKVMPHFRSTPVR